MRLMTIPTIALWSAALMGCASPQPPSAASVAPPGTTQFRQVTSPKGTKYVVSIRNDAWRTPSSQLAAEDAPSDVNVGFTTLSKSAGPTVAAARTSGQCTPKRSTPDKETFNGVDREVAKTTVPKAPVETFASVATLRADIAKQSDDFDMMDSGISTKCDQTRVEAERRNVSVVGYLYALLNEPDNDFHLILGTKTCKKPDCFMTAEVSGIPRIPANRKELADVRKQFQTQIQPYIDDGSAGGGGKYFVFDPPIPVRVVGPLFYDSKHKIDRKTREGAVGPEFARPSTSWEIHPVTQIDVNPDAEERPNATLPILMLRDSQATLAPRE